MESDRKYCLHIKIVFAFVLGNLLATLYYSRGFTQKECITLRDPAGENKIQQMSENHIGKQPVPDLRSHSLAKMNKNSTKCSLRKSHFGDILVIMIYHFPFYDTIPLLKSYYQDAFKNLVICGPKKSLEHDIIVVDIQNGYYGYECVGVAIRRYPYYNGYLYINDDTLVNWWTYLKLDKNKIWLGARLSNFQDSHLMGSRPFAKNWNWWAHSAESCEKSYDEILKTYKNGRFINVTKLVQTHLINGDGNRYCYRSWSDVFYIPKRFSDQFQRISSIFHKNHVFLETAVPTIATFLDPKSKWENIRGMYLPDIFGFLNFADGKIVWQNYNFNITFMHPVKFHGEIAEKSRINLKKRVIPHSRELLNC